MTQSDNNTELSDAEIAALAVLDHTELSAPEITVVAALDAFLDRPKPHKPPTLTKVIKQAKAAGIDPSRIEVKPDGTVVVVTGKPEPAAPDSAWPLDEFRKKETKQ